MKIITLTLLGLLSFLIPKAQSDQLCDTTFSYQLEKPRFSKAQSPAVWIDEAHNNFHTKDGRYCGFTKVLEADGYQVSSNEKPFDQVDLSVCDILVIANALDEETNIRNWNLPNRSAFTSAEIEVLRRWVSKGGSLMLIADHMPFPGCNAELAAAFGFTFTNGYAVQTDGNQPSSVFSSKEKTLLPHPITAGIPQVASFTGQAFRLPEGAEPLLVFGDDHQMVMTSQAGPPDRESNPTFSLEGWSQGAVMAFGQGRVAVFGEAAMFTSQRFEAQNGNVFKFGFHHPTAAHNDEFLLNTMQWLSGNIGWDVPPETAEAIFKQNFGMEEGMRSDDMQNVADYYLDDAIVISPGGLSALGREQVDEYWAEFDGIDWRLDVVALAPTLEKLQQSAAYQQLPAPFPDWTSHLPDRKLGELVYQLGKSNLTYNSWTGKRLSIVDFLIVWEKQSDNSYKILVDTYR